MIACCASNSLFASTQGDHDEDNSFDDDDDDNVDDVDEDKL